MIFFSESETNQFSQRLNIQARKLNQFHFSTSIGPPIPSRAIQRGPRIGAQNGYVGKIINGGHQRTLIQDDGVKPISETDETGFIVVTSQLRQNSFFSAAAAGFAE